MAAGPSTVWYTLSETTSAGAAPSGVRTIICNAHAVLGVPTERAQWLMPTHVASGVLVNW